MRLLGPIFLVFLCYFPSGGQEYCPDWIAPDSVAVEISPCETGGAWLCIPVSYGNLSDLTIEPAGYPLLPCRYDTLYQLAYASLPGGGALGPYLVNAWQLNGMSLTGAFNDPEGLAALMNLWDAGGNWTVNPASGLIEGGQPGQDYGPMQITQSASGLGAILFLNASLQPRDISVFLPTGEDILTITNTQTQCFDSIRVRAACTLQAQLFQNSGVGEWDTLCMPPAWGGGFQLGCPDLFGELIIDLLSDTCVAWLGADTGSGGFCLWRCDTWGLCDTVWVEVNTAPMEELLPQAWADSAFLLNIQPIAIPVLANDSLRGPLKSGAIVQAPTLGEAFWNNEDGVIRYEPPADFCLQPTAVDSFFYRICNDRGCDSTRVTVWAACQSLRVYSGFSPNSDGVNDYFVVEGILNFPDNSLTVFNRWGETVFFAQPYFNNWDGTWKNNPLPDGAYFYLLEYGGGRRQSGFLEIRR